ncbi:N-acetylglucosamine kinase [Pelomonas sp. Root1217]|uniref:N-acetylglucosamine kinase n=1 Tax=Pelomonas sp. Root1217 TaxID=1736430 RepID=UPI00070CA5B0|nr:BadF/BadG/BcrA/BcrD ATPase family protein [Pelomonas sp. Root1217]KQV47400.1 N-acetylglucosamine kinase [Pelomonas sp. Root1217]
MSGLFLGIDGGGTKTAFVLVDETGRLLARHESTTSYYIEIGFDALRALLRDGVQAALRQAGVAASDINYTFAGLPAHGEDSELLATFDALLTGVVPHSRVGNDMICSWAGSLAGADGISLVAGTGSIAYGEWMGRGARCGGWGEVFGDEGSAHWLAREVLALFSRMADYRAEPGPLLGLVREHFELKHDLDLCGEINGSAARSELAQVARLATAAANAGDVLARQLLVRAGDELAALAAGAARSLGVTGIQAVPVSYSGGVFAAGELVLGPLQAALARRLPGSVLKTPRFGPELGAALYAARLAGRPLPPEALARLDG